MKSTLIVAGMAGAAIVAVAFAGGMNGPDRGIRAVDESAIAGHASSISALQAGTGITAGGIKGGQLANGSVSNAQVSASAAIGESKLAALGESPAGGIITILNGAGTGTNLVLYVTNGLIKAHSP